MKSSSPGARVFTRRSYAAPIASGRLNPSLLGSLPATHSRGCGQQESNKGEDNESGYAAPEREQVKDLRRGDSPVCRAGDLS